MNWALALAIVGLIYAMAMIIAAVRLWRSQRRWERTLQQRENERKARQARYAQGWVPWPAGASDDEKAQGIIRFLNGEEIEGHIPGKDREP